MTKDEHNKILSLIKSKTTDTDIINSLVDLEKDYSSVINDSETLTSKLSEVETERDEYAKLNNKLWLQQTVTTEVEEPTSEVEEPQKLSYEDLESDFKEE